MWGLEQQNAGNGVQVYPDAQIESTVLLTSALAPLIRLSYGRMVIMALPYTVVMGATGLACVALFY